MIEPNPYQAPSSPLAEPPPPAVAPSLGWSLLRLVPWSMLLLATMMAATLGPMLVVGFEVCLGGTDCLLKAWARHAVVAAAICLVYRAFLRRTRHRHGLHCVGLFLLGQGLLLALGIASRGGQLGMAHLVFAAIHAAGAAIAFFTFRRSIRFRTTRVVATGT